MNNTGRPGTKSLLDYGLIDGEHINTVTSFVIDHATTLFWSVPFSSEIDPRYIYCLILFIRF